MNVLIFPALITLIAFSLIIYLMAARLSGRKGAYPWRITLLLCFFNGVIVLCGIGYMSAQCREAEKAKAAETVGVSPEVSQIYGSLHRVPQGMDV